MLIVHLLHSCASWCTHVKRLVEILNYVLNEKVLHCIHILWFYKQCLI